METKHRTRGRTRSWGPLWLVLAALLVNPAAAGEFKGRVVGVTDGDTIKVLHDDRAEIVRLVGVDAPE